MKAKKVPPSESFTPTFSRRITAVFLAALLCMLMIPATAFAGTGIFDDTKTGTLTLNAYQADGATGLNGAEYLYVKVATATTAELKTGGTGLAYLPTSSTAAIALNLGITLPLSSDIITGTGWTASSIQASLASSGLGNISLDQANTLIGLAGAGNCGLLPLTSGGDATHPGTTSVSSLSTGLYLVLQVGSVSVGGQPASTTNPFLCSLPTGSSTGWIYDVVCTVKNVVHNENISKSVDKENVAIGETFNYTVTAKAQPTNDSTVYTYFGITDVMEPGIDRPTVDQVTVTGSSLTLTANTDYQVTLGGGNSLNINFTTAGLTKLNGITQTETLTLHYPAKLNTSATLGTLAGNTNTVTLAYTHKNGDNGSAVASEDVYTYGATMHKVSSLNGSGLSGAKFKLYKNTTDAKNNQNAVSFYGGFDGTHATGSPVQEVTTDSSGNAFFFGLPAGNYYLMETQAPTGFTLLNEPILISIGDLTTSILPSITIANVPNGGGIDLPITGENGILLVALGGLILVGTAGFALVHASRRRKEH